MSKYSKLDTQELCSRINSRLTNFPDGCLMLLTDIMVALGRKYGVHTMVRYDPERHAKNWTLLVNGVRVCDTDTPWRALAIWALEYMDDVDDCDDESDFVCDKFGTPLSDIMTGANSNRCGSGDSCVNKPGYKNIVLY